MSLKGERVEHLDHKCEVNAPVIIIMIGVIVIIIDINIVVIMVYSPNKSIYILIPDVMAEHEQSVLNATSSAQGGDQLSKIGFPVVHLETICN